MTGPRRWLRARQMLRNLPRLPTLTPPVPYDDPDVRAGEENALAEERGDVIPVGEVEWSRGKPVFPRGESETVNARRPFRRNRP